MEQETVVLDAVGRADTKGPFGRIQEPQREIDRVVLVLVVCERACAWGWASVCIYVYGRRAAWVKWAMEGSYMRFCAGQDIAR